MHKATHTKKYTTKPSTKSTSKRPLSLNRRSKARPSQQHHTTNQKRSFSTQNVENGQKDGKNATVEPFTHEEAANFSSASVQALNQAFNVKKVLPDFDPIRVIAYDTVEVPIADTTKISIAFQNFDPKLLHSIRFNVPSKSKHSHTIKSTFKLPDNTTLAEYKASYAPVPLQEGQDVGKMGLKQIAGVKCDTVTPPGQMLKLIRSIHSQIELPLNSTQVQHMDALKAQKAAFEEKKEVDGEVIPWSDADEAQLQIYLKKPKFSPPSQKDIATVLEHPLIADCFESIFKDGKAQQESMTQLLGQVTTAAAHLRKLPSPTHTVVPIYPGAITFTMKKGNGAGQEWQYVTMSGGVIRTNIEDNSSLIHFDDIAPIDGLYSPMIKAGATSLSNRTKQLIDFEAGSIEKDGLATTQGPFIEDSIRQTVATLLISAIIDRNMRSPRMAQYLSIFKIIEPLKAGKMDIQEALMTLQKRFKENPNIPSSTAFLMIGLKADMPADLAAIRKQISGFLMEVKNPKATYEQYTDFCAKAKGANDSPVKPLLDRAKYEDLMSNIGPQFMANFSSKKQ